MRCRSFASLVALASFALIAGVPAVASAARDDASLGAVRVRRVRRGLHAELTAIGEGASSDLPAFGDERAAVRDEAQITPAPQDAERRWYGWQTLLVDAVSIAAMPAAGVGFGGYLLGAPIVHARRDHWGIAAASLGLRIGLPIAGGYAGVALENCPHDSGDPLCGLGGALLGIGVGMLTAIVIDAAVLSYESAPAAEATSARPRSTTSVALTPWIERDRKGASLAVTF